MSVNTYSPRSQQFKVGDYVVMKDREGYIRYIGKREHHHGTWYGIELFVGHGPNDGSEHGKRYFSCKQRHGIFVRLYAIKSKLEPRPIDPRKLKNKAHGKLPLLPQSQTLSEADNCSLSTTSTMRTPSPKAFKAPTHAPTHKHTKSKAQYYRNLRVEDRPESIRGAKRTPWQKPPPCRPKSARMSKTNAHKSTNKDSSFQLSSPRRTPSSARRPIKRYTRPHIDYNLDHSTDIMDLDLSSSAPSSAADTSDSDDIMVLTPKANKERKKKKNNRNKRTNRNHRTLSMNRARSSDRKTNSTRNYRTLSMNKARSSDKPIKIKQKVSKRNASRQDKKGKKKRKHKHNNVRNVSRARSTSNQDAIHDRNSTDIHSIYNYKKRTNSSPQKKQKKANKTVRKKNKSKDANRTIKAYNKRTSFHRRKSKTMDFDLPLNRRKELFKDMEGRSSTEDETSSESEETEDDDDDEDDEDDEDMDIRDMDTIALPSLKNSHSADPGKYTFRLHIKKDSTDAKEKEYRLVLPAKEEDIPLRLQQSYSLRSDNPNGTQLCMAMNDGDDDEEEEEEDEDEYYEVERTTRSNTLTTDLSDVLWNSNNDGLDGLDGVGFTSMRPPELSDDLLFISQNNVHEMRRHVYGSMRFEIEESVIEYHVPSMTKQNRNKNIKINIHINNDINNKKKGNKLQQKQKHNNKTVTVVHPSHKQKHVSGNASVGSSGSVTKKKMKKKKHKHSSHHHHKSRHKSKKNCSCHKHNKEKKKEKKKKKAKKSKPQIKFRPKLPKKSKTPRARGSVPPPPPISPRNGSGYKRGGYNNVRRFGWNGLV